MLKKFLIRLEIMGQRKLLCEHSHTSRIAFEPLENTRSRRVQQVSVG